MSESQPSQTAMCRLRNPIGWPVAGHPYILPGATTFHFLVTCVLRASLHIFHLTCPAVFSVTVSPHRTDKTAYRLNTKAMDSSLSRMVWLLLTLFMTSVISTPPTKPTTTQPPLYTIPCTIGNNAPCPTSWFCTQTETCHPHTPCHGVCFTTPPLPPVIPCTVGNNAPCPSGSTCTPTMVSTPSVPWGGQCISAPTPTSIPTTVCTVGNNSPCGVGSTCTPTMTCTTGLPCGGACIGTPTPVTSASTTRRTTCY